MLKKISLWIVLGFLLVVLSACAAALLGDMLLAIYLSALAVFTVLVSLRE